MGLHGRVAFPSNVATFLKKDRNLTRESRFKTQPLQIQGQSQARKFWYEYFSFSGRFKLENLFFPTCSLKILINILQSLLSTSRILSVSTSVESNETHTQIFNLFQGTYVLEGANVRGGANVLSRANVLGKTQFFLKRKHCFCPPGSALYMQCVQKSPQSNWNWPISQGSQTRSSTGHRSCQLWHLNTF